MRRTPEEIKAALAARRAALEAALEQKKAQKRRRVTVMSHAAVLIILVAAFVGGGAWIAHRATPPPAGEVSGDWSEDPAGSTGNLVSQPNNPPSQNAGDSPIGENPGTEPGIQPGTEPGTPTGTPTDTDSHNPPTQNPGAPGTSGPPEGALPPASAGSLIERLFSFAPQEGALYELTAAGSLADALPREEGFLTPAPQDQQGSEAERESAERLAKAAVEALLLPHEASLAVDIGQESARPCLAGEEKRPVYLCGITVTVCDTNTGERYTVNFAILIDRSFATSLTGSL